MKLGGWLLVRAVVEGGISLRVHVRVEGWIGCECGVAGM